MSEVTWIVVCDTFSSSPFNSNSTSRWPPRDAARCHAVLHEPEQHHNRHRGQERPARDLRQLLLRSRGGRGGPYEQSRLPSRIHHPCRVRQVRNASCDGDRQGTQRAGREAFPGSCRIYLRSRGLTSVSAGQASQDSLTRSGRLPQLSRILRGKGGEPGNRASAGKCWSGRYRTAYERSCGAGHLRSR